MDRISIKRTIKTIGLLLISATLFTSCNITGRYMRPADIAENIKYRDMDSGDTASIADIPWKEIFGDTLLQGLIEEGIENNLDLKIAVARIKQAEANLRQSNSAFYPTLQGNGSFVDEKAPNSGTKSKFFQVYGSTSWEADIWGKLRSTKRAAHAAFLQSDAYKKAVQTRLISDVATNYYILLAYDKQLQITLQTVENRKLSAVTMKQLKESDVVTGAAVVQSEANRYSVEVTIPDLKQNIRETENALCILIGRNPGNISRDSLYNQQILIDLKTGIASQLLANRPDVQEAEYQLRYYFELTNAAKTYFYPSFTITAEGGFSNASLSRLFSVSSLFGNVIGGMLQPIFNHGLNIQRLKMAEAQQEEYLSEFKKTLLNASNEVSNALYNYQAANDKIRIRSQQIDFLQKSVEFTKELLKYSVNTNYTDVLTSEQSLLSAELSSVNDKVQQLKAMVELYRSLGGGWK